MLFLKTVFIASSVPIHIASLRKQADCYSTRKRSRAFDVTCWSCGKRNSAREHRASGSGRKLKKPRISRMNTDKTKFLSVMFRVNSWRKRRNLNAEQD